MRQALTRMMVGLCLVLVPSARGDAPEAGGADAIARARRLIEAGDHAAALTLLEDALLEARAKDQPGILHLLRQSYAIMARKAEESGRPGEAAQYRENLAILDRGGARARPAPAPGPTPEVSGQPRPAPIEGNAAGTPQGPSGSHVSGPTTGPGGTGSARMPGGTPSPAPVPRARASSAVP